MIAKGIFSLSLMLDAAMNHLKIQQYSQETFEMWRKFKYCFTDQSEINLNFIFLISKMKKLEKIQIDEALEWVDGQMD